MMLRVKIVSDNSVNTLPKHIAIIMDGNGRWAQKQDLPRGHGHRAGLEVARKIIPACAKRGIEVLTLFAFSSENWRRPPEEVELLMSLFVTALNDEIQTLNQEGIRLRFIGDRSRFNQELQARINEAESLTKANPGMRLVIAANYGGQWDIAEATKKIAIRVADGEIQISEINEQLLANNLTTADLPEPDLFIRTSGEQRISNFLIWQLAYCELYFSDVLWPDFDEACLEQALQHFANRERRFGHAYGQPF